MANKKKKEFFLVRWFKRVFLGTDREVRSILEEEQVQTPLRTVVHNFVRKKSAMLGVIVFLCIFALVIIGPYIWKLDLSEQDSTLINLPPGYNMMSLPKETEGKVSDIAAGRTYGIGVDTDGHVYTWGHTRITDKIDIADIPEEVQEADLSLIAAGDDHAVALDENGQLYVWGNTRLRQDNFSRDMEKGMETGENWDIIQLEASNQFSAAVSSEGTLYLWGNPNMADVKIRSEYQGNIAKVALTANEYVSLLKDGTVAYTGYKGSGNPLASIPEGLTGKTVVDIASTGKTAAALTEDGEVYVWGNATSGEANLPVFSSRPVALYGGRFHYTALLEDGSVVSWGNNKYGQTDVPASLNGKEIVGIYTGNFQNYALDSEGNVHTWGLKGFLLGTDDLGRDMLTRIINGGRVTMTVGAISVVIATFIGVLLGGLAGYFGGKVDILVMRIAEIVGGLPFIPFAMILSAVIGSRIDPTRRMYLIMVVLGVLSWTGTCRLIRAQILAQREMEYVTAAKAMGISELSIVFRHIMPNVFSILLVSMTLDFATCMLTESTLSYLGFGIPLPTPTWGNLLDGANNSVVIQQYWWRWVFPAAIFGMCTICINLIGDGLRDAIDPKSNER
ncbi:MAG TPA: ABC transporter permease subunit [Candidatus Avichristensenella intestinipullorum]|uniref:ABC transporter permease subunit n=1 Tax=Candidatus Avichristensenella intestinipullorum TaxID=2840693 RepID=A0A9D0YYN6_9FIRM|nr:ABC transporter permease subunit [Candidatus Avichristensenella intestinipullorum]